MWETSNGCVWTSCCSLWLLCRSHQTTRCHSGLSFFMLVQLLLGDQSKKCLSLFQVLQKNQLMCSSRISHLEKDWSLTPQSLALCNQKSFDNSSISQGFACNEYAQSVKVKNFGNKVTSEGHIYLPFVVESFGGFSEGVSDLVDCMISSSSTCFNQNRIMAKKFCFEKMSCVLMKHIARPVSSRCSDFFLPHWRSVAC